MKSLTVKSNSQVEIGFIRITELIELKPDFLWENDGIEQLRSLISGIREELDWIENHIEIE